MRGRWQATAWRWLAIVAVAGALAILAAPAEAQRGAIPEGWARVTRLVDGDTMDTDSGFRVRLYGIQAPELDEPCGAAATNTLRGLLTDKGRDWWVWVEYGPRHIDQFGRALGYVWVQDPGTEDWWMVDEWMALLGSARAWTEDGQYRERIVAAERDAQENGRGCLWASRSAPPVTAAPPPPPPAANCDPSYPTVCIPPPPPDLDCPDIPHRNFVVLPPDPHRFDADRDGVGCES
jgi:micrococcal nuclease